MHSRMVLAFHRRSSARLPTMLAALLIGACSADPVPLECDARASTCHVDGGRGDGSRTDGSGGDAGPRPGDLLSLAIAPVDPVINVVQGMAPPPLALTVTATQRDGMRRMLTSSLRWQSDNPMAGSIDPGTGIFTAGAVGGAAHVRVDLLDGSMLSAMTTVTVNATRTVMGPGVPADIAARFDGATHGMNPMAVPTVDYPLEGAVMPRNVFPPQAMWTQHHPMPAGTDFWRVRLARPHATVIGYFSQAAAGFQRSWQLPADGWATIAQSDLAEASGPPIQMTVSVLAGTTVHDSAARSWKTVDGVIAGAVYYWSPTESRLRRIDVEPARLVDFMPAPGDTCIGCHSVSRDGTRLAGILEPSESIVDYDVTRDLTGSPAPTMFRVHTPVRRCTSFNNTATRLLSGDCGANPSAMPFSVLDTATGSPIALRAGMSPGDGFDPEWSPDINDEMTMGSIIAFTDRSNNLAVTPVSAGDTFGPTRVIHMAGSTPGGNVDWHPTWTPNGRWLVYQHGETRRTAAESGSGLHGTDGALWVIAPDGTRNVRLDALNGGPAVTDSYRPIFSPFDSGGYFWLLFTSTRNYGNAEAGLRGAKQIWVAAIRDMPTGAADPSSVPYYLAGQERATALSPYWAPPPCRRNGTGCTTGNDCCSGTCDPDMSGAMTCRPPTGMCRMRGMTCSQNSDCCTSLMCTVGRICDQPPPG